MAGAGTGGVQKPSGGIAQGKERFDPYIVPVGDTVVHAMIENLYIHYVSMR